MTTKLMRIQGMTCAHCEKTVAEALTGAGALKVEVDWRQGQAMLDPMAATAQELSVAVEEAGYKVSSIEDVKREAHGAELVIGEKSHDYDLVVLGSGSAAFAAAITATEAGATVALMESNVVGGTCVNVGCVPSKAMLAPAEAYFRSGHHPFVGIRSSADGFDLGAMVDSKAELVNQLRAEKYLDLAREYGFTICHGRAEFVDAESIACDGERIGARHFIIATGASPTVPPIEGLAKAGYLTSATALELREPPRELVVIGANAMGLEMGQLFMRLGSKVTFLDLAPRISPFEEPEVSESMQSILQAEGAEVVVGAHITSVVATNHTRLVTLEVGGRRREVAADQVLVATGRRPNTAGLGLEKAGVAVTQRGAVKVDDSLRTTNPVVWAAGDVTGHPQFVYVAAYEGHLAAGNIFAAANQKVDFTAVPRVTFTSPTIAAVGLTDEQAAQRGISCQCRVLPMSAVPRALVNRDTRGFVKIVAEAQTGRIRGATVVADGAGDVIQAAIYAVQFGLTTDQVAAIWAPYLTFAEGFRLAAQTFTRDVSKLSCCAA